MAEWREERESERERERKENRRAKWMGVGDRSDVRWSAYYVSHMLRCCLQEVIGAKSKSW